MYARPEVSGELPELPIMLQPIPWVERKSGDFLKQKAPYSQCVAIMMHAIKMRPIPYWHSDRLQGYNGIDFVQIAVPLAFCIAL
eukprot:1097410-Pelagomonas_calceolata.AAC.1